MKKNLANISSLLNGFCGLVSIAFSLSGNLEFAIRALFFAFCFDALDGTLARYLGSRSNGKWLDRHMDRISMCIAPAALLVAYTDWDTIAVVAGGILIFSGLEGLRYTGGSEYFSGLPISVASLLIMGTVMGSINVATPLFMLSGMAVSFRDIHYPRRLSVARNGMREPLPLARFVIGRTWIVRVACLLFLAIMPSTYFGALGAIIFWVALLYAVGGPFFYQYITRK